LAIGNLNKTVGIALSKTFRIQNSKSHS